MEERLVWYDGSKGGTWLDPTCNTQPNEESGLYHQAYYFSRFCVQFTSRKCFSIVF